jgi:hypothetical protein
MLPFSAAVGPKSKYIFHAETEAANNELNAKIALQTANEHASHFPGG